ncbi:MAG: glycosyltransferase family 4 protein [Chitinivibrionia bacterium]|nr:glycosyltransferase family 4 protein [Chitinivibrionia bacterium]
MNVLIVSSEYPPESPGGLGNAAQNLARGLASLGVRPHVLSSYRSGEPSGYRSYLTEESGDGVPVIRIPLEEKRIRREPGWWWRFHPYYLPLDCFLRSRAAARACREIIRGEGIDVVQFSDYRAEGFSFVGRSHAVPCVVRLATPLYLVNRLNRSPRALPHRSGSLHERIAGGFVRMLEQKPIREATAIASPSRDLAGIVRREIHPKGIVRVIPTGIDLGHFSRRPERETIELRRSLAPDGEHVVLFTGRYEYRKGVHDLVEAFAEVRKRQSDCRLVCAGGDTETSPEGGSMKQHLARRIASLGLEEHVTLLDRQPYAALPALYSIAAVFAAPSLYENLANTLLEAMACGAPVIGTTSGGASEVIGDPANGRLVPPGDARSLAAAILDLLSDTERCTIIGATNERTARERFSRERMARDFIALYREIL